MSERVLRQLDELIEAKTSRPTRYEKLHLTITELQAQLKPLKSECVASRLLLSQREKTIEKLETALKQVRAELKLARKEPEKLKREIRQLKADMSRMNLANNRALSERDKYFKLAHEIHKKQEQE